MAKKSDQLGDWGDDVPEEVQDTVDNYMKALRSKNRAQSKLNSAKESCIETMIEHGVKRVRIDDGKKVLICEDKQSLKTEKIKDPETVEA